MRKLLYAIIALVAIGIIYSLVLFLLRATNQSTPAPTPEPTPSPTPVTIVPPPPPPAGNKIQIGTTQGSVQVNNFYLNPVYRVPGSYITFKSTDEYAMLYYEGDSSFTITINSSPVAEAARSAEADFLAILGISQQDACRLKVIMGVPYDVSPNLAGTVYGLSFCPNSGLPRL